MRTRSRLVVALVVGLVAGLLLAACADSSSPSTAPAGATADGSDAGDCVTTAVLAAPEKAALLTESAALFNRSEAARVDGRCVVVQVRAESSVTVIDELVEAAQASEAPDDAGAAREPPVAWWPSSQAWTDRLDQRLVAAGLRPMAGAGRSILRSPLVIAMPAPMAEALGHPDRAIGFADLVALARDPRGWGAVGHPEWGPFRFAKADPQLSTTGLRATLAAYAAAAGRSELGLDDLQRPDVAEAVRALERTVVYYGDSTMAFLDTWLRADQRGTALTFASAVAVEERAVAAYNAGDPDGVREPGEKPRRPRTPLVALWPAEGTLVADHPFVVLDAPWVDTTARAVAEAFQAFLLTPDRQARAVELGFRPATEPAPAGPSAAPEPELALPGPEVVDAALEAWEQQRRPARVLLVVDVSSSMREQASDGVATTKLDLAEDAVAGALAALRPTDDVGLRAFAIEPGAPDGAGTDEGWRDVVPIGPLGLDGARLVEGLQALPPADTTPLYEVVAASYAAMLDDYDPERINAVVLLTDGRHRDTDPDDDDEQLDGLLDELQAGSDGSRAQPVRLFPIAYGPDADVTTLRRLAEATNATLYDAVDPARIDEVVAAVVANF